MSTITVDNDSLTFIANLVRRKSAIVLEEGKGYLIESRLTPIVREHGLDSLQRLVDELQKPNALTLTEKVVEAMTTNETSFFRDIYPFQALQQTILPQLIAARSTERCLTIWSNACSTGQEPYTIAMVIKEHFPQLAGWRVQIYATDLCKKVLDRARNGAYCQTEMNRGLPMPLLLKYFKRDGLSWQISEDIKKMVRFVPYNLTNPIPAEIPRADIVFLRNVLIYFNPEVKSAVLRRVHGHLKHDGFLFLGGAETTLNLNVPFRKELNQQTTYYRPA